MYQIYGEKCCGQHQPGCLTSELCFSWKLEGDGYEVTQDGYRIVIYAMNLEPVWDSGVVKDRNVHNVPVSGFQPDPITDYMWKVISISSRGEVAESGFHIFSTGILNNDWHAEWIEPLLERKPGSDITDIIRIFTGQIPCQDQPEDRLNPAVYFRRQFQTEKKVKSAKVFITAHGVYQLYINGHVYGKPLAPGFTAYQEYLEYQCYSVTESLLDGENTIGVIVADGWYLGKIGLMGIGNQYGDNPALLFQIVLDYEDGTRKIIGSDADVRVSYGAYIYGDLFVGERYDSRLEPAGWTNSGFDASKWNHVETKDYGFAHLRGSADEPAAFVRIKKPESMFYAPNGDLIVNAGENISGVISIRGIAKANDVISLEHCEVLDKEGNFLKNIVGQNKNQTDVYVAAADGEFYYLPCFTFHGFQYVRISGIGKDDILEIRVHVLATDMDRTGRFQCSDGKINQLMDNIFRSQQGNMLYIPTDCPQREKAGWTGDMQAYAPTAALLMDVEAFLRKWLANMCIDQLDDGQVPNIIPHIPSNDLIENSKELCSAGWGDACIIVPYRLYMAYGDKAILEENLDMMERWMSYVAQKAAAEIPSDAGELNDEARKHQRYLWNTGFHFGDWLIPSLTRNGLADVHIGAEMTKEIVASAMYAYTADLMVRIYRILENDSRAAYYSEINRKIKEAFAYTYLKEDGRLTTHVQGTYVLALQMDLVPEDKRALLTRNLVDLIHENDGCLDTGFVSMPFLLDVLYDNGCSEEAYKLLFQDKCPSWLYEVDQGANTMWESWTNINENGERSSASYNHFAFGCVGDFIYRKLLGLNILEPGYRKILIRPDFGCGLTWAKGSYDSIYGKICISWMIVGDTKVVDVEIPPDVQAVIQIDDKHISAGSGSYHFVV